jgi:hypothetical protein
LFPHPSFPLHQRSTPNISLFHSNTFNQFLQHARQTSSTQG